MLAEPDEASATDLSDLTMGDEEDINGNFQVPPPVSRKARQAAEAARAKVGLFHCFAGMITCVPMPGYDREGGCHGCQCPR